MHLKIIEFLNPYMKLAYHSAISGDETTTSTTTLLRESWRAGTQPSQDDATGPGNLVTLTESTQAVLEVTLSTTLANTNCKKGIEHIGVLDCDSIWCPKLDPVIQAIVLNEATKGWQLPVVPPAVLAGCNCSPHGNHRDCGGG